MKHHKRSLLTNYIRPELKIEEYRGDILVTQYRCTNCMKWTKPHYQSINQEEVAEFSNCCNARVKVERYVQRTNH